MEPNPRFARWVFRIAGIYGLLVILPGYFTEHAVSRDYPPAITHREYYYGFLGVTLAWQIAFLVISTNPVRYRPLMLVAIVEKLGFFIPGVILYLRGRSHRPPRRGPRSISSSRCCSHSHSCGPRHGPRRRWTPHELSPPRPYRVRRLRDLLRRLGDRRIVGRRVGRGVAQARCTARSTSA